MSFAPASLTALGKYLTEHGAVNLGVVGNQRHCTGYHLGRDRIYSACACRPDGTCEPGRYERDYSVILARDRSGLSNAASAIDIGKVGGTLAGLQELSQWLSLQCQAKAADTKDIRELIYSPDGTSVKHWNAATGVLYDGGTGTAHGDNSHRTHTHVSYYRDSEARDKTAPFRRYFEGDVMALGPIDTYGERLIDLPAGATEFAEDGKTPAGKTAARTGAKSPFGYKNLRAYYVSVTAGVYGIRWAAPSRLYDAPDPTPYDQADIDAAIAVDRTKAKIVYT